jgi:hypothetical protein
VIVCYMKFNCKSSANRRSNIYFKHYHTLWISIVVWCAFVTALSIMDGGSLEGLNVGCFLASPHFYTVTVLHFGAHPHKFRTLPVLQISSSICIILVICLLSLFWKMEASLCDLHAVCMSMNPLLLAFICLNQSLWNLVHM